MNEDVKNKLIADLKANIENGNTEAFAQKMIDVVEDAEKKVREDFEAYKASKEKVLPKGYRVCTENETKWLDACIELARTKGSTAQSLSNVDVTMPETIFNEVFEEITTKHPLVREVDVIDTKNKVKWLLNTGIEGAAVWGDLCDAVDGEIKSGFAAEEVVLQKLTAYMFLCLTLLDLGYEWLMRYCVVVLAEAIAVALEDAIVNGNGSKKPIGMSKDIVVDEETGDVTIEDKTPIDITSLDAKTLGSIYASLANGGKRTVKDVIMVVNSNDYYTKVLPAIAYKNALGEYTIRTALPIRVVECNAVAQNKAIFGMGKNYRLLLGLGEDGKLTYSDDFKFLDDVRTIKQKLVGNGRAKDNASFIVANIANLAPDFFNVKVVEEEASI